MWGRGLIPKLKINLGIERLPQLSICYSYEQSNSLGRVCKFQLDILRLFSIALLHSIAGLWQQKVFKRSHML